jgi:hypothetical membrane protein
MSALLLLHNGLFRAGLLITVILGIWGLVMYFRRTVPSPGYRASLVLTEGLFIVQGLLGVGLFFTGNRPKDPLHWLYGVLLVIALPVAASYTSGRQDRRQSLIYGIVGIFMAGLCVRAFMTH